MLTFDMLVYLASVWKSGKRDDDRSLSYARAKTGRDSRTVSQAEPPWGNLSSDVP